MAVSITAPNSRVVDRSGCVQVTWMPGYPQSAYEILYRRKGEESWNTFGRVESTANSVELDLSVFENFTEYHYRVICYYLQRQRQQRGVQPDRNANQPFGCHADTVRERDGRDPSL